MFDGKVRILVVLLCYFNGAGSSQVVTGGNHDQNVQINNGTINQQNITVMEPAVRAHPRKAKPANPYVLEMSLGTAINSNRQDNSAFFLRGLYGHAAGCLFRINIAVNVNIINPHESATRVDAYDLYTKNSKGAWTKLVSMRTDGGPIYFAPSLKTGRLLVMPSLDEVLDSPIPPRSTVAGWVFAEFPYPDTYQPRFMKMVLRDSGGTISTVDFSVVKKGPTPFKGIQFRIGAGAPADLTGFKIRMEPGVKTN